MKKYFLLGLGSLCLLGIVTLLFSMGEAKNMSETEVTVVDSHVNFGKKIFVLSDGATVVIKLNDNGWFGRYDISFYDASGVDVFARSRDKDKAYGLTTYLSWCNNVSKGTAVMRVKEIDSHYCYYTPIIPKDTKKYQHVVKRVTKYDGGFSNWHGEANIAGSLLSVSGSGNISGEEMHSKDFFINIYFEDRDPISVNAAENPLWLDVEVGDTITEEISHGRTTFSPQF